MKKQQVKAQVVKPFEIRSAADVWSNLNTLDKAAQDLKTDINRTRVRVQVNRQRIEMIKLAVRNGALKGNQLALSE